MNPTTTSEPDAFHERMFGDHCAIVALRGIVSTFNPVGPKFDPHAFLKKIEELIKRGRNFLILDVSEVKSTESSIVPALVHALQMLREERGELCFVDPPRCVHQLLSINRLEQSFEVYGTLAEAIVSCEDHSHSELMYCFVPDGNGYPTPEQMLQIDAEIRQYGGRLRRDAHGLPFRHTNGAWEIYVDRESVAALVVALDIRYGFDLHWRP